MNGSPPAATSPSGNVRAFVRAIFDASAIIELRHFKGDAVNSEWGPAGELPQHVDHLEHLNRDGWQTSISVNPRRARGLRGDKAVDWALCVLADFDGIAPDDALNKCGQVMMPMPTITIASGHGTHCYWRLSEPMPANCWKDWQLDLAALLGSDPAISNPERVMRLPGFWNLKREPVRCTIIESDPTRRYDLADLPIPMRPGSNDLPPERPRLVVRRIEPGSIDPIERCRRYIDKMPAAIAGAGGHAATYRAACVCVRFGLSQTEAIEVMTEYSARCDPPWSDRDIRHKVDDAYRRNAHEHGDMLVKGAA